MIPKKIHYVWVGGKELPDMAKKCLASWKEKLPDFEIVRWDETNSPMDNAYVKKMYAERRWAFVADYIRFWVLEKEGGVYLDTDSLVLKHFDDTLMRETFFGRTSDRFIGCGVIGAHAHDSFIQDILAYYDNPDMALTHADTSPHIVTKIYDEKRPAHVRIYDYTFFNPCEADEKRTPEKLKNAYVDNLWAESWVPFIGLRRLLLQRQLRRYKVLPFIKKILKPLWDRLVRLFA